MFLSVLGVLGVLGLSAAAAPDDPTPPAPQAPSTAEILGKIHSTNVKEYRMGTMARDFGRSQDVRTFGAVLIGDHDDLDTLVVKLAKFEDITLAAHTPVVVMEKIPMGAAFDTAFAKAMARDHAESIKELRAVLLSTSDQGVKSLLDDALPVLEKHEEMAQKIIDRSRKS
jgi:putative membrane protein